jgi:hypothetical protein
LIESANRLSDQVSCDSETPQNPTLRNCSSIHSLFQISQLNCRFPLKQSMCPLSCPARSNHRHVPNQDSTHIVPSLSAHIVRHCKLHLQQFLRICPRQLFTHVPTGVSSQLTHLVPRKLDRFLRSFLLHSASSPQQRPSNKQGEKQESK